MCVDRRKSCRTKRYELGFRLTIDWCVRVTLFAVVLLIYFSSANPVAYQNSTGSENFIAGGSDVYNALGGDLLKSKHNLKSKKYLYSEKQKLNSDAEKNKFDLNIQALHIVEVLEQTTENLKDATTVPNMVELSTDVGKGFEFTTTDVTTLKNVDVDNITGLEHTTENIVYETTVTNQNEQQNVPTTTSYDIVESLELNYTTTEMSDETTTTAPSTTEIDYVTTEYFTTTTNVFIDLNSNNLTSKENTTTIMRECKNCDNKNNNKKHTTKKEAIETTVQNDYNLSYEDYEDEIVKAFSLSTTSTTTERSNPFNSLRNLASSFIETLYETYVPKTFRDVFKRMQDQNDRLEMARLRSREENGGLGQFGRSIIKGLSEPLNQLMQGVRDYGSLDSDKNFFAGVASDIVSLADSVSDAFKDRVRAIYPGTLWCGDGDMARSAEVGLFFMTDNCCKRHDACKYYIPAGATKYGLTNTGLFTRSHCECDRAFYKCLKRTNSFISMQIGLTYFSILGPQCFRHEHPIVKCNKKASGMTGSKCEEYQLDYKHPKMWQWFDNETF